MSKIVLNENQAKIVEAAKKWYYHESSTLFQFDGKAGTGKSVVLNAIVKALNLTPDQVLPIAFTGQAAIVMRTKGFKNAVTCHSGLYDSEYVIDTDELGNPVIDPVLGGPVMKWRFYKKDFTDSKIKLIVLDECRMVNTRTRQDIEDTGIKCVVAGDIGQLPPVAGDPGYLVDGKIYHLTELMRQSERSPIVYLAQLAREGKDIPTGTYGNSIVITKDEFEDTMASEADIVICCKNDTRSRLNDLVRNIRCIHGKLPVFGERVICRKNNWQQEISGISLANGLVGTVTKPPDIDTFVGGIFKIDFLPDLLDLPFRDLDCDYTYFISDYKKRNIIKNSPYSKGEKFEFAYASTCHLVQGSEYQSGVYIEENTFFNRDTISNLNYTAITRFKDSIIYVKDGSKKYY